MMRLQPYRPADREGCLALFDSNVPTFFAPFEREAFIAFLDALDPAIEYLSLYDGQRIVACGGVGLRDGEARMCWGIVDGERHGEKLGTLLLLARLIRGRERGANRAGLDTIPRTVPFFERFGFRVVGGADDFYGPGIHRRDMILAFDGAALGRLERQLAELTAGRVDTGRMTSPRS